MMEIVAKNVVSSQLHECNQLQHQLLVPNIDIAWSIRNILLTSFYKHHHFGSKKLIYNKIY